MSYSKKNSECPSFKVPQITLDISNTYQHYFDVYKKEKVPL